MSKASPEAPASETRANRALISIFAACVIGAGAGFALWFGHEANQQEALRDDFAALDEAPSIAFANPLDCTSKTHFSAAACGAGQTRATDISWRAPIANYRTEDACVKVHGPCNRIQTLEMWTPGMFSYVTRFYPPVVGWQARAGDLSHAVPLYGGSRPGTGLRADGRVVPFGPSPAP